jgi:hypothetical protein
MKILTAILSLFVLHLAHAALLVEPVVGYNFAVKSKINSTSNPDSSGGSGVGYGGRLGYQNFGFQLGLDYLASSTDMDEKDLYDDNFDSSEWGAFVGFEFPAFLRVYAGYIFSATAESKTSSGDKWEFSKGSGYKVGIGFTTIPFIDVNLEYRAISYDENEALGATSKDALDFSAVMLSLSVPLAL